MELSRAAWPCCLHGHVIPRRSLSDFAFNPARLFSPYVCHRLPPGNVFRITLCIRSFRPTLNSMLTAREGHSIPISEESCDIVWILETDLDASQLLLYITGDLPVLGGWQPKMAVQMLPTEDARLWKAEVKAPSGVNFKYNYFVVDKSRASCDISWRPGPKYSLSVPLNDEEDKRILVRDSWMEQGLRRSLAHVWGLWTEETHLVEPSISCHAQGHSIPISEGSCDIVWILETDLDASQLLLYFTGDLPVLGGWQPKMAVQMLPTEDARLWKAEVKTPSGVNFEYNYFVVDKTRASCGISWRRGPKYSLSVPLNDEEDRRILVRDSWMKQGLQRSLAHVWGLWTEEMHVMEPSISCHSQDRNEIAEVLELEELGQLKSDLKENNQILKDRTPSTIILINSSICTMQRIAVLEDGKLVELLLEPVNSDAVCDSIYLGVVTQLAPGMEGAFVDIGRSISTFMEIKHHIEPFVMEPQKTVKQEVEDSFLKIIEELQSGIQVTDESVKSPTIMSDDREDHGDDYDLEFPSEHTNGSALDYEEVDDNCQHIINLTKSLPEGAISSSPTANPEKSDASHVHNRRNWEDPEVMLVHKNKWKNIHKGSMIIVQVVREELGTKAPMVTPYPRLRSRFWILLTRSDKIEVSQEITGAERKRLEDIAKGLQPPGFGLEVRTLAAGHSSEELEKDLKGLLMTWNNILESASTAALAADEATEGAVPVMLHKAMGQTLSVVQNYFSEKVMKVVIDSPRTYDEVTNYLRYNAPDLYVRVELYNKRNPLFSEYNIEEEINNILNKRVPLDNGGSLVIEQTEALVSIDVNGGHMMLGQGISQEKASLDVNLAAAKQIARELRLRDIGGIIVVDFIDMGNEANKRLVYREMKRAVDRDGSNAIVKVSELSEFGLMQIIRQRVRPSVPFMISEACTCCHGTGRVEALDTTLSKIEQEICRLLASRDQDVDPENPKTWPKFRLWVDHHMFQYLTSGERTRLAILSSSLNVWLISKVDRGFSRGSFKLQPFNDGTESDDIKSRSLRLQALLQPKPKHGSTNPQRHASLVAVKKAKTGRKKAKICREAKELSDMVSGREM